MALKRASCLLPRCFSWSLCVTIPRSSLPISWCVLPFPGSPCKVTGSGSSRGSLQTPPSRVSPAGEAAGICGFIKSRRCRYVRMWQSNGAGQWVTLERCPGEGGRAELGASGVCQGQALQCLKSRPLFPRQEQVFPQGRVKQCGFVSKGGETTLFIGAFVPS